MAVGSKPTVSEWIDSPSIGVVDQPTSRKSGSSTVIGLVGTLLLHSLALQSVVLDSGAQKRSSPERQVLGLKGSESVVSSADSLVFVDLSGVADGDKNVREAPSIARAAQNLNPIAVNRRDADSLSSVESQVPSADSETESSPGGSEAGVDHARLVGIYSGQIRARVERVWERPRTPMNEGGSFRRASNAAEYFQCQVRIVQDTEGNVQALFLPHCNGTTAWQNSLRIAIQRASPLPAPPSRKVFSRVITLNFVERDSIAGETNEIYETGSSKKNQRGLHAAARGVDQSDKEN